jgi:hypothetical protein
LNASSALTTGLFFARGPDALTRIEAQLRYSLRLITDAAANLDILTEPVDSVVNDGSATAVVPLTVVTVVPVRAVIDTARTNRKLNSVRRRYRSRSQSNYCGEREDYLLHLAPPLRSGGALGPNDPGGDWFRKNEAEQRRKLSFHYELLVH